jgi:hypothetical protein
MNEILYKIGIAYNNWYKTKDPKYKDEWYELIEQFDEEYNKNALQRKEKQKYYLNNKEKMKLYYLNNIEKKKQYDKEWYLNNKEKKKQYDKIVAFE